MRKSFAIAALVALVLASAAGCGKRAATRPPCPAGEVCLAIGNAAELSSLDPHHMTGIWEARLARDALVGLTIDNAAGETEPGMATAWETSPDGKVWTFHLREAVWSDGVPVTADDFVFSYRRSLDPKTANETAALIYVLKNAEAVNGGKLPPEALGVRAIDARTLEITLEHPAPYLLELTKHLSMLPVPRHAVEKWGDAWAEPAHFVANGPFRPVEWRLGDYAKLEKNPRFYEADTVCPAAIYYYPTNDAIGAERRVLRGELDISTDILSNRIAYLKQKAPGYPRVRTWLGVAYVAFNSNVPGLKDPRVRRALSMAIDRDFITGKLLRGGQLPAYTFTPEGMANYTSVEAPEWSRWSLERRQAEARRLLAEAGYGPGNPFKVEIKLRNSPDPTLFYPAIQADWKSVGVEARIAQVETQVAYADFRSRNFEAGDAAWIADYNDPITFLFLMQSGTGAQNYGDYKSPAYDALLAKADNEADAGRRALLLAQAERIMLDDAPVAPIFFYVSKNLVNPQITGWIDNLSDRHPGRYLCRKGA
jgi:oligopeptide transport system substrate-binding protein